MRHLVILLLVSSLFGQLPISQGLPKSVEFSPNTSSIFGVMGMSPSIINTFGSTKEVHLDWVVGANGGIQPNIAIEFNPIWMLGFRSVSYTKYTNMNYFVRHILGESKLSVGNTLTSGTTGKAGLAVKFNLYQQADPLTDKMLASNLAPKNIAERANLVDQLAMYNLMKIFRSNNIVSAESQIVLIKAKIETLEAEELTRIKTVLSNYAVKNWNKAYLDLGYAFYMDYVLGETNNYSSFAGTGTNNVVWLNGGFGIGTIMQISLLDRYSIGNMNMLAGINIRLGNAPNKNGFLEYFTRLDLLPGSTNIMQSHIVNFGGTYQFNPKLTITLGLKLEYVSLQPKPFTLIPSLNVAFQL